MNSDNTISNKTVTEKITLQQFDKLDNEIKGRSKLSEEALATAIKIIAWSNSGNKNIQDIIDPTSVSNTNRILAGSLERALPQAEQLQNIESRLKVKNEVSLIKTSSSFTRILSAILNFLKTFQFSNSNDYLLVTNQFTEDHIIKLIGELQDATIDLKISGKTTDEVKNDITKLCSTLQFILANLKDLKNAPNDKKQALQFNIEIARSKAIEAINDLTKRV